MRYSHWLPVALALTACGRFGATPNHRDGLRVVSVSKQLTEIVFAVGGDTALVGVDISSTYPPAAKKITTVGYHRALNAEGIISLNPSVVWNDGNWGPPAVIDQLRKVGIPLRQFDGGESIDSTKRLIRQVAQEFHNPRAGDSICARLDADMDRADSVRKTLKDAPRVLIIHFGQAANQYFVLNRKGIPEKMLEWAGAVNAADTAQKWRNLSPEVIAEAQPDVILATDYGYDLQGSLEKFKQLPGISLSPAARNNRIYRIEEHDLVYLGPRTGQNVLELIQLIHQR
ncbi:MAG TPA: ABC transporter substrate-binding protein [Dinghuibacter sp.]|jgi:iron complex transport system substrate-binding protein|uniref:heme/hemin ABC transporter substrate-binding protein n=1 Tax=Dinghuibacter sp. TaxID=2024697 RepID=UPI002CEC2185|nr:ABC transporter substrate-binding protein [Dinghuibacter sp.]HTJ11736.1 ABC transporter substrate-binding protein [Dinghuibacter sp.]